MQTLIEKLEAELDMTTDLRMRLGLSTAISITRNHSDWIKIEDAKPQVGERVKIVTEAVFDGFCFVETNERVELWQPLPTPPTN